MSWDRICRNVMIVFLILAIGFAGAFMDSMMPYSYFPDQDVSAFIQCSIEMDENPVKDICTKEFIEPVSAQGLAVFVRRVTCKRTMVRVLITWFLMYGLMQFRMGDTIRYAVFQPIETRLHKLIIQYIHNKDGQKGRILS